MGDYDVLAKSLRICGTWDSQVTLPGREDRCKRCGYYKAEDNSCGSWNYEDRTESLLIDAADAIEELLKAARAMHLWIFLNTGDEEKAYEECGLSDEMNLALGYRGKMVFRSNPPEEET